MVEPEVDLAVFVLVETERARRSGVNSFERMVVSECDQVMRGREEEGELRRPNYLRDGDRRQRKTVEDSRDRFRTLSVVMEEFLRAA